MIDKEQLDVLYASKRLSDIEKDILSFIANNLEEAITLGANGIARSCYTSTTTITRLAKKLGFKNSHEMLFDFRYRLNAPNGIGHTPEGSYLHYQQSDLDALFKALGTRGTIGISGQGYSGIVAEYFERKILAFGCMVIQQEDLEPETIMRNFGRSLNAQLCISKSGETGMVLDIARQCKQLGVPVIAFTGSQTSPLASLADSTFVINDDAPFDIENVRPNFFFAYCILAFEEMLHIFEQRGCARPQRESGMRPDRAAGGTG